MNDQHSQGLRQWQGGNFGGAQASMAAAAKRGEDSGQFHRDFGGILAMAGNLDKAMEEFERAEEVEPQNPEARFLQGLVRLLRGQFAEGWPLYLQRRHPLSSYQRPVWDGAHAPASTVLLYADQGLGDCLQFVRHAPLVRERCGQLNLLCKPELAGILSTVLPFDEVSRRMRCRRLAHATATPPSARSPRSWGRSSPPRLRHPPPSRRTLRWRRRGRRRSTRSLR